MKKLFVVVILLTSTIRITAVSRGPIQPEYASFEAPGSTDMVNLVTGDFNYSIPLIDVPGPAGGYKMALSYHAGIELEEEASWVGLGWGLNAGALTRSINNIPDDFSGEEIESRLHGPSGSGFRYNLGVIQAYYDSNEGKRGRVGLGSILSVGFGNDLGLTVVGVTSNWQGGGVSADPVAVMSSIMAVASVAAGDPSSLIANIATQVGVTVASEIGGALIANANSASIYGNVTNQNYITAEEKFGFLNEGTYYSYKIREPERNERRYGALYLGEAPTEAGETNSRQALMPKTLNGSYDYVSERFEEGVLTDVAINFASNSKYHWSLNPTHIAYDNYFVNAPDITGSISPYRMDMGSMAFVSTNTFPDNNFQQISAGRRDESPEDNVAYQVKPWLNKTDIVDGENFKVPFRYTSAISNSYTYHSIGSNTFNENDDVGIEHFTSTYNGNAYHNYRLIDSKYNNRTEFIEGNGYRSNQTLKKGQLATGNFIQYFTNEELTDLSNGNDVGLTTIYQDHQLSVDRSDWRSSLPPNGIGGFVITNTEGVSYHFTIPVYQVAEYIFSGDDQGDPQTEQQYIEKTNNDRVATTWLLTAITGLVNLME